jgi:hypothetical protein
LQFHFKPGRPKGRRGIEAPTFTVRRLWIEGAEGRSDVTDMIDGSYGYHSARELAWHLADRFGAAPGSVMVERV